MLPRLVAYASTLWERIEQEWPIDPSPASQALAARRLAAWRRVAAGDDPRLFAERLARDGLSEAAAVRALGMPLARPGRALPAWAETLASALDTPTLPDPECPAGLARTLAPFVALGRRHLTARRPVALDWLSATARRDLERWLWNRLVLEAEPTLAAELASFRTATQSGLTALLAEDAADAPSERAFVAHLSAGGLERLLAAYPALARLLSAIVENWVDASAEMLDRLAGDWTDLRAAFPALADAPPHVEAIAAGLGDPHRGGRSVAALTFLGGGTVVYKPRPLVVDHWLGRLADSLPVATGTASTPRLLLRPSHGWAAWVDRATAHGEEDRRRRARSVGALGALLHAVAGADAHAENVVMAGGGAVLVDAEMVGVYEAALPSLAATGLLPVWHVTADGPVGPTRSPAADLPGEVEAGFRDAYARLLAMRPQLLEPAELGAAPVRHTTRATATYDLLLRALRQPGALQDGADRSIQIDALATALLEGPLARLWPALRHERAAVEVGDVPFFVMAADGTDLATPTETVLTVAAAASPRATIEARLAGLGDDDLTLQVGLLRASLGAPMASRRAGATTDPLSAAVAIGEQVAARAIRLGGGAVTWAAPLYDPGGLRYEHRIVSDDLYAGRGGIAIFLAGLAVATGHQQWRDLALAALRPLPWDVAPPATIGGVTGLASLAYARACVGTLLREPSLLVDAQRIALAITLAAIATDRVFDVRAGAAGAVLGLLAVAATPPGIAGGVHLIGLAAACGEHLLASQRPSPSGGSAWPTGDGRFPTGFAHGAAGIAYALARLAAATGDARYRAAATEAIAYETALYSPADGNWPNLVVGEPEMVVRWCGGAAGIGLARLGVVAAGAIDCRGDVARAVAAVERHGLDELDTLCCGNAGRIELLLATADELNRPDLREMALGWAATIVERAADRGWGLSAELPPEMVDPGLFRGLAGVGYTLLRLSRGRPDELPSVLLWR